MAAAKSQNGKKLIIVVGAIVLLLVAGVLVLPKLQKGSNSENNDTQDGSTVFTSIKDALSKSVSLECSYTDEEGRKTITYLKNGAIRSDMTGENAGSVIVKDRTMYTWDPVKKQGMKMTIPEVTPTSDQEESSAAGDWSDPDQAAESLEQYKESCKAAVVSDALFTPPADVTFTDYSEMMQNNPAYMQQYGN